MVRKLLGTLVVLLLFNIPVSAQTDAGMLVKEYKQHDFCGDIRAGNYSGITAIGGNLYAVVNDKSKEDGFHIFKLRFNKKGNIRQAIDLGFRSSGMPNRDGEDIVHVPSSNTLFISGEADNEVFEYTLDGKRTGRKLAVPEVFKTARPNKGLEALAYDSVARTFWITSESTLKVDGDVATAKNGGRNRLRLQSFDEQLQPLKQFWYLMDEPHTKSAEGSFFMGVSAMTAIEDGRLLVLEREVYVPKKKIGAYTICKIYLVNPEENEGREEENLQKTLVHEWRTDLTLVKHALANYEGMCLGPKLKDGSRVLLLIADSQNQYYGVLKDWFKTVVINM